MNNLFDNTFLDTLLASAAESPRLRMNHVSFPGSWHTIEVLETSVIFEAKDGAYRG